MSLPLKVWLALPAMILGLAHSAAAGDTRTPAVIELFTSQGCSSCPLADALLQKYAERPDIVALSFSVDYWDYLGWKDTLANPRFTYRQRAYAEKRGDGHVYTPQVVVNGMAHAIGSNKDEIEKALSSTAETLKPMRVPVTATSDGKIVTIEADPDAQAAGAGGTIWLAVVQPTVDVKIGRGENTGKLVTYTNVVRDLIAVGAWANKPVRVEVKDPNTADAPRKRCAVLLQKGKVGPIVGAAWMAEPTH
jgi:hypothetical protein